MTPVSIYNAITLYFADNEKKTLIEINTSSGDLCTSPVEVYSPLPVKTISCGKEHVLLLSTLGTILSYGSGRYELLRYTQQEINRRCKN